MSDPATEYTYAFLGRALPAGARRLLEIGCGKGELAARLQADGFEVVAIDADPQCVEEVRSRGIDARVAEWPCDAPGLFDAVLFTRSLHHVERLDEAVAAALGSLRLGGRVIVEDFDSGFADEATLGWFAGLLRVLAAGGVDVDSSDFLRMLAAGEPSPLEAWRGQHHHNLHSAVSVKAALRGAASSVSADHCAYLFRYVAAAAGCGPELLEAVRAHEEELVRAGTIAGLGRRFVAER